MSQEESLTFSGPVGPHSPELQILFDVIAEQASERDRLRRHPFVQIDLIRKARFGAFRLPVKDGGGGASLRQLIEAVIQLAQADSNVAHILRNHFNFVERYAFNASDPKQKKFHAAVVEGAIFGVANTEIGKTSRGPRDYETRLVTDGDGFRLNGDKYYSTGCYYADFIAVRTGTPDGGLASAIIPANREGLELRDDWNGMGQRLTGTGSTVLRNVSVHRDEVVLDKDGENYGRPYSSSLAQLFLTAVNAGILRAVLQDATELVKRRKQVFYFAPTDVPAQDPILQMQIGQIASNGFGAEACVLLAAEALDRVAGIRQRVSNDEEHRIALDGALSCAKAKIVVDELALRTSTLLFDVGGASATAMDTNLHRHWRNVRTLCSHNPAAYKAQAVGANQLHGTPLPKLGFF